VVKELKRCSLKCYLNIIGQHPPLLSHPQPNKTTKQSPTHSGVSADNQHGEVGRVAGQAEYRRLEVLVVASQVNQRDELTGRLTDLLYRARLTVVDHLINITG